MIYLCGKISGDPNYKEKFAAYERYYSRIGRVFNPCTLDSSLPYDVLMGVCLAIVRSADLVVEMPDYPNSPGARAEVARCISDDIHHIMISVDTDRRILNSNSGSSETVDL